MTSLDYRSIISDDCDPKLLKFQPRADEVSTEADGPKGNGVSDSSSIFDEFSDSTYARPEWRSVIPRGVDTQLLKFEPRVDELQRPAIEKFNWSDLQPPSTPGQKNGED